MDPSTSFAPKLTRSRERAAESGDAKSRGLQRLSRSSHRFQTHLQVRTRCLVSVVRLNLLRYFANRYDNGTDEYDTSEKMRVPAFTGLSLFASLDLNLY